MLTRNGRIKLEGTRIGRLTVLEYFRRPGVEAGFYRCVCDCGKKTEVRGQSLRTGNTQSCGCLHKEVIERVHKTHGLSHTKVHNVWMGMLGRCENPKNSAYASYGGRGIKVCKRWHNFFYFLQDMGFPDEKQSIERQDNNGDYEKSNCIWTTMTEQANNRRSSRLITYNGRTQTQAQWEKECGLRRGLLWERLHRGWSVERALTTPLATRVASRLDGASITS